MNRRGSSTSFVIALTLASMLSSCGQSYPELTMDRLASRSTINISANISEAVIVRSDAYTRGEGAAVGALEGASGAIEGGLAGADPLALPLAIVLLPVFVAAGSAYGAVSGTSKSRDEITRAVNALEQAFRPTAFGAVAEAELAKSLEQGLFVANAPCFTIRSTRNHCSQKGMASNLKFQMAFDLVPAKQGSGAGKIDFLGSAIIVAEPLGILGPECVSLEYRRIAGDIFDLAKNGGAPLDSAFRSMLQDFARELPSVLTSKQRDLNQGNESPHSKKAYRSLTPKRNSSNWTRLPCSSWQIALK